MRFERPLVPATLTRRYKRFLADVVLEDGEAATIHCPNPGSMLGLAEPGMRLWLSPAASPTRKLPYSWEITDLETGPVGINTGNPNRIVAEALAEDAIPELAGYDLHRREVRYGKNSRIDLLLESEGRPSCYLEIKNVHLSRRPGLAEFPDSVTSRGLKHLGELAEMVAAGGRAVMLYLVQRGDCASLAFAGDLDPAYAQGVAAARERGVEFLCYDCDVGRDAIVLRRRLPFEPG